MSKRVQAKGAPGASYLVKLTDINKPGEKCEHKTDGFWVVEWKGEVYSFDHRTQMQKDIWLNAAESQGRHGEAIQLLRWYCFQCGTVQKP